MHKSSRNGAETSTPNNNRGAIASAALLLFFILVFKFSSKGQVFPNTGEEQLVYSKYSQNQYDNTDQSLVDEYEDDIDDENVNDPYDDYGDSNDYNDDDDNENDSVSGNRNPIDASEGTAGNATYSDSDENETLLQQKPIVEKEKKDWGKWKFWDGYGQRPEIKYTSHENRDVPSDDIPDESWHADAVYINHFLDAGMNLVSRTKEAIVAEYGLDNDLPFHINVVDIKKLENGEDEIVRSAKKIGGGGWIESKSLDGLMLRLLHAMMTEDEFHVVVAGDSSAVGLGNNFNQSYAMQFHELMEPVFDRFGVKLVTRNMAHRSGATIGMSLAGSSLYDSDIDILVWDAPLTKSDIGDIEFFHRQALLSGNRVPLLWGGVLSELSNLHRITGADVGIPDWSTEGVPVTKNDAHALELPWAARYLNCEGQFAETCPTHKFNSICWIDRDDITPPTEQKKHPDGQEIETNLGFREHRFRGRKLSYLVLTALGRTLDRWMEKSMSEGYPIDDDMWHVSDYFNAIRGKTSNMHNSFCESRMKLLPRLCNVPLKGRSEYTPRFKPDETSIRSILTSSPNRTLHSFPSSVMLYDVFDLPILSQKIPDDALNVVEIAGKRLLRRRSLVESSELISKSADGGKKEEEKKNENLIDINTTTEWSLMDHLSGYCDGQSSSHCNRNTNSDCLLDGHHDSSSVLIVTSGWITLKIPEITKGLILATLYIADIDLGNSKPTKNKNLRNLRNNKYQRRITSDKGDIARFIPDGILLDISIDGHLRTYQNHEFDDFILKTENGFATVVLLDDDSVGNASEKIIGLQLRCKDCKESRTSPHLEISHIYWS
eukprot:CAMPEP_0194285204 /NCGR_PEP_ID=MMETSP0169-20130528/29633_1 /TAXON_ID=218684 /ORGANISM="Corethron pennatum, Strain L29A3" /LENGTH=830 /DNA_ID=CAMNT_0039031267 /DNA_START=96 /DNA_END=2588 /DNA_ORIENTATION=+